MLRGVYGEGGVERFKKTYFSQMSRNGQPVSPPCAPEGTACAP